MPPHPDAIADCVLAAFRALPTKCKPQIRPNGLREWVPLAGIVLDQERDVPSPLQSQNEDDHLSSPSQRRLVCVALATGMKCLPQSKLTSARGNILHDWHAEVLTLRGFNRWLIDECARISRDKATTEQDWIQRHLHSSSRCRFALANNVKVHMYCSEAPCGDASMELTMADQHDPTPWSCQPQTPHDTTTPLTLREPIEAQEMLGRGHFDRLGIVRRKPARPDAPTTNSKSCSDKLAMKQTTGLTNSLTSLLIEPIYLSTLVLPHDRTIPQSIERAFGPQGRMQGMQEVHSTDGRFSFRPFRVETTTREFEFAKTRDSVASNLAVLSSSHRTEVLINGVLQGRKQSDSKGACSASRRKMWMAVREVLQMEGEVLAEETYESVKSCDDLVSRREMKRKTRELALKPWPLNVGDEDWSLDD